MNNVDYDKDKFNVDEYGNLIPKDGLSADETYGHENEQKDQLPFPFS